MTVTFKAAVAAGALLSHSNAAAVAPSRALGFAALITWLLDAGSGAYMLGTWIARGGLERQRSRDRLGPAVVFGHFGLATTGLLMWVSYLTTRLAFLGWLAMGLLMLVIGLGTSAVTLWTPFPANRADDPGTGSLAAGALGEPAKDALRREVTDEELTRALTDEQLLGRLVDDVLARVPKDQARDVRKPKGPLMALIPAGHGVAAVATFLLAVLTVVSAAR